MEYVEHMFFGLGAVEVFKTSHAAHRRLLRPFLNAPEQHMQSASFLHKLPT